MADQAARETDPTKCRHYTYALKTVETRGVNVNGLPAAKALDASGCVGKLVVTGSGTVTINSRLAARAGDLTMDGTIVRGSPNVVIGGPRTGATAGSADAQKQACQAAANSRTSGSTAQSYGNCGLEAWRNAINKQRAERGEPPVTEDELLKKATGMGLAGNDPVNKPWSYGATNAEGRMKVLKAYGIDAHFEPHDAGRLRENIIAGKAVSLAVHPGYYWPGATEDMKSWGHEIAVTGVQYDASGKVVAYVVNDTGLGTCGLVVPAGDLEAAFMKGGGMTVSDGAVW
jgi:uncharacterized Zn-binding protein involved in type VI secretion